MRAAIAAFCAATLLAGCAAPAAGPEARAPGGPGTAHRVNAVLGTPFYAAFKAVTCVATVAIAAPGSAVVALTDRPDRDAIRAGFDYGVAHNCGGSWILDGSS